MDHPTPIACVPTPLPPRLPAVVAVVTVECAPRPGQEFGDVHTATARAATRLTAELAAGAAAVRLAVDRSPGTPFRVKTATHR